MGVRTEREGAVATVVLCRPERKNAIDRATAEALLAALLAADGDPGVGAIVLWGRAAPSAPAPTCTPSPPASRTASNPKAAPRSAPRGSCSASP